MTTKEKTSKKENSKNRTPKRNSRLTRDQLNEILKSRYPTDEELLQIPLGSALLNIPNVDPRYGIQEGMAKNSDAHLGHIRRVLKGMNILLSDQAHKIVADFANNQTPLNLDQHELTAAIIKILKGSKDQKPIIRIPEGDLEAFFRICVLYHDIGKSIITERHPLVGWHLIKDVENEIVENQLYPLLLGVPESEWAEKRNHLSKDQKRMIYLFESVILFHDLFGVLSTGEASLPVMIDLIDINGVDPDDAKELFSVLMLFNLADLYGSVSKVHPYKVSYFCNDWRKLCKAIEDSDGNRIRFFNILREEAQKPENTLERINRFLKEGTPSEWLGEEFENSVKEIFRSTVMGSRARFYNNFALFCKLDYALKFKLNIMRIAKEKGYKYSRPMESVMWLFAHLESQYGSLCKTEGGTWRRIGLELAGLSRQPIAGKNRQHSSLGNTICKLLLESKGSVKGWAAGEVTIWFMEE